MTKIQSVYFITLWANPADDKLILFSLFFQRIDFDISLGDKNLHEMSKPIFSSGDSFAWNVKAYFSLMPKPVFSLGDSWHEMPKPKLKYQNLFSEKKKKKKKKKYISKRRLLNFFTQHA